MIKKSILNASFNRKFMMGNTRQGKYIQHMFSYQNFTQNTLEIQKLTQSFVPISWAVVQAILFLRILQQKKGVEGSRKMSHFTLVPDTFVATCPIHSVNNTASFSKILSLLKFWGDVAGGSNCKTAKFPRIFHSKSKKFREKGFKRAFSAWRNLSECM